MKSEILQELKEKNFYICKLLISNEKQDLFIGYEDIDQYQYENELILIKYNINQSELQITELMFEALQLEQKKIEIQSPNTIRDITDVNSMINKQKGSCLKQTSNINCKDIIQEKEDTSGNTSTMQESIIQQENINNQNINQQKASNQNLGDQNNQVKLS
ncbi:hypothetical protein ABPG74_000769 [Tetrahymena malaccensis]